MSRNGDRRERTDAEGAAHEQAGNHDNGLAPFRSRLDEIDDGIARLLGERLDICREVARHKSEHGIPMMQPERVQAVRERYLQRGAEAQLPADFTARLFELLIETTCRLEDELMQAERENGASAPGSGADDGHARLNEET